MRRERTCCDDADEFIRRQVNDLLVLSDPPGEEGEAVGKLLVDATQRRD
jgi:hypothetical protein